MWIGHGGWWRHVRWLGWEMLMLGMWEGNCLRLLGLWLKVACRMGRSRLR